MLEIEELSADRLESVKEIIRELLIADYGCGCCQSYEGRKHLLEWQRKAQEFIESL